MHRTTRYLAPRIDKATWEQHRETITRLYINEGRKLKGNEGVMHIMSRDHGFSAT